MIFFFSGTEIQTDKEKNLEYKFHGLSYRSKVNTRTQKSHCSRSQDLLLFHWAQKYCPDLISRIGKQQTNEKQQINVQSSFT